MLLSEKEILSIVSNRLPEFCTIGSLQPLDGGNLNHVWRLKGEERNLIIKIAPPHIASNPEMPLSSKRIQFEAKALKLFEQTNLLSSLASDKIRPPHIQFYDHQNHLLVMEDIGPCAHLGEADLADGQYASLGQALGKFIAKLHSRTYKNGDLAARFNNIDIQKTRLHIQYRAAAEYAQKGGIEDVGSIQGRTERLGKQLLQPGKCLIMGDLWPPSILMDRTNIRLIDWEFAHFGNPLQDVGHFAAHCWMLAHSTSQDKRKSAIKKLWGQFWTTYQEMMEDTIFDGQELRGMATHAGAEILVRAAGPFKSGYIYEAYNLKHPLIKEASQKGTQLILSDKLTLF